MDIGTGSVKLAYREGGSVKLVKCPLPENLVGDEGGVIAPETLATLMAQARKDAEAFAAILCEKSLASMD
jgi:hypothetical protein